MSKETQRKKAEKQCPKERDTVLVKMGGNACQNCKYYIAPRCHYWDKFVNRKGWCENHKKRDNQYRRIR